MSLWRASATTALSVLAGCSAAPAPATAGGSMAPTGVNDGVECFRYEFSADAPRVESVAAAFAARPFPSPADRARLTAQGLQVAIIRTQDLDPVRRKLGVVTEIHHLPVGQTAHWLQLARKDLGAAERLRTPSDFGRRPVEGSVLRLSLRSWLVPDALSGSAQVEVIVHAAGAEAPIAATAGDPPVGTPLLETRVDCRLTDGETLLILPCPPAPTGKGPATAADLPPTPGMLLLGEPRGPVAEGMPRGHATVVAISAHVPQAMRPTPLPSLDSGAPIAHTTGEGADSPSP